MSKLESLTVLAISFFENLLTTQYPPPLCIKMSAQLEADRKEYESQVC